MDFLRNAWTTIQGDASAVWDWFKRSPIEDFNAGLAAGQAISRKVTTGVTSAVKQAGGAVGSTIAGTLWATVLPLLPILIIAGVGFYFLRRRGG